MKTQFKIGDEVLVVRGATEIMYKYGSSFMIQNEMKKCENKKGVIYAIINSSKFVDAKDRYKVVFKDDYFYFVESCLELYDVQRLQMIEIENII